MTSEWPIVATLNTSTSIFLALFVIACCTRFLTGRDFHSALYSRSSPKTPAIVPYVLPYVGHYATLCFTDVRLWIQRVRLMVPREPFAAHILGRNYNIVIDPSLVQRIYRDHFINLSFTSIRWHFLVNCFGASTWHRAAFLSVDKDAHNCLEALRVPSEVKSFIDRSLLKIQEDVPSLVSFSRSVVDQNSWERSADPTLVPTGSSLIGKPQAVEVSMFALVRSFVGHVSMSSLVGTNFLEVHPRFLEDLWGFESKWQYMLLGVPRWLPIPGLPKAYIARRNLLHNINSFHRAVEKDATCETPEQGWSDLEDVSTIFRARSAVWRDHQSPTKLRAAADLSLLWAANVKPSSLIFWMLLHIFSSPGLVEEIREETRPYIAATQPPNRFRIPEPPQLVVKDLNGLLGACPLLRACFHECLRLYAKPMAVREVTKAFSVIDASSEQRKPSDQRFAMNLGTFIVAPLSLYSHSASLLGAPERFNPKGLLSVGQDGHDKDGASTSRPWGLDGAGCPGKDLAERQVLVVVAAIVSLWNFEPAELKGWSTPQLAVRSVVAVPKTDIRVLIKARELPSIQG